MKKILIALTVIFVGLFTVACSSSNEGEDESFKVALAMSGAKTDGGWNQTAYEGLVAVEEEIGATITYSENIKASDFERVLRDYAKEGNDIVIGHGNEFGDAATAVAEEFPDIQFIVTSTDITNNENLGSISNNYYQAGFLQGAFAAMMTESNVIAAVGGMQIPPIVNDLKGYDLGAKYINPDITILSAFTGSFDDANMSKEQALTFIQQGADIVMVDADHAGRGVYVAAEEQGVWAIASIAAEYEAYQSNLIACGTADMATGILEKVKEIHDTEDYKAGYQLLGVEQGIVDLTFSPFLDDQIPADVKEKIIEIKADMDSGELDVVSMIEE